jgi:carbamoyl-phosphate synthase large subunit
VPFVAKATGVPLADIAARLMVGAKLEDLGLTEEPRVNGSFVKESVLPFIKFLGEDPVLGPEMRSTGEVMGVAPDFGAAFAKSQIGAGTHLPLEGTVFISVNDRDKQNVIPIARGLAEQGFSLVATKGTAELFHEQGLECRTVYKVLEGRPNVVDLMKNGEIHLILNTPFGGGSHFDEETMRRTATERGVPLITTLSAGHAAVQAIRSLRDGASEVRSLQEIYAQAEARPKA